MSTVDTTEIRLWPGAAPGSEGGTRIEDSFPLEGEGLQIRNVVVPTITPCLPAPGTANGTSMVIAPGGGFITLAWEKEGVRVADWLCRRGVTCFLLKYRLLDTGPALEDFQDHVARFATELAAAGSDPEKHRGVMQQHLRSALAGGAGADGVRAVEYVRERAAEFDLRTDRIGFIGFSAGAFVAAYVATQAPGQSRPDFVAPIYGGAAEWDVPADAPPLFTAVAADDVLAFNYCWEMYEAWHTAGRPAELHVYAQGGHGFGLNRRGLPVDTWIERLAEWMRSLDVLPGQPTD